MTLSGLNLPFSLRPQSVVNVPRDAPGGCVGGPCPAGRTGCRRSRQPRGRCPPGPDRRPRRRLRPGLPPDRRPGPGPCRPRGPGRRRRPGRHHHRHRRRPVVAAALVVGAEPAAGEPVQALRPVARHPLDGGPDPVEAGRPLRPQRAEHGVLGEIRIPGDPLPAVGELPVRVGDLRIHRRQLAVDLRPGPVRHVGQGQARVGTVDGGQLTGRFPEPPGRRTGRALARTRVDVDRDQPTSAQDQRGRGGDRPVGRGRTFLARCASHGTPPLRGFESEA